jgi:hypothetical protein
MFLFGRGREAGVSLCFDAQTTEKVPLTKSASQMGVPECRRYLDYPGFKAAGV